MTIEQLRREVEIAIGERNKWQFDTSPYDEREARVRAAFDAYDKARDAANKPTFEGDEAEVRENLRNVMLDAALIPYVKDTANQALALLDAKDAENDSLGTELSLLMGDRNRAEAERDAALSRAEQAEAALAEERKAMSEAASYAIEDLREWLVNYPDAYDRDTTEQAITTLSRFILPAKPAVDPLVAVLEAAGYAVFQEDLERVRAAIERAGGVKAVFGEGL